MKIESIDHIVITVKDIEKTITFYESVLGMEVQTFGQNRKGLSFGKQRINLHEVEEEINPRANQPTSGSADFCLISSTPINEAVEYIKSFGIEIEEGPVNRGGALGMMESIYIRDPDYNLVEISYYL